MHLRNCNPQFDLQLIHIFEQLHPAYTIGLFEDFKRRHPQYAIEERWDGRWVLSTNRPRFLTGTDVPDLIAGSLAELRILFRRRPGAAIGSAVARRRATRSGAARGFCTVPALTAAACRSSTRSTTSPWRRAGIRLARGMSGRIITHTRPALASRICGRGLIHINVIFYKPRPFPADRA